ncbi:hypothetical protein DERF_006259 [Dermatophagoides farinae]|uniref:Uncharacterized protein n=1 Tax=Dermatophagoides farinae TaxID=6954 RepID=A0A922I771_DERFA|nr:hypothetical protein DERF_006259 [Dermatophagoides farinae]
MIDDFLDGNKNQSNDNDDHTEQQNQIEKLLFFFISNYRLRLGHRYRNIDVYDGLTHEEEEEEDRETDVDTI